MASSDKFNVDVTKIKSIDDCIDLFNEHIAGTIVTVTGEVLVTEKIDKINPQ